MINNTSKVLTLFLGFAVSFTIFIVETEEKEVFACVLPEHGSEVQKKTDSVSLVGSVFPGERKVLKSKPKSVKKYTNVDTSIDGAYWFGHTPYARRDDIVKGPPPPNYWEYTEDEWRRYMSTGQWAGVSYGLDDLTYYHTEEDLARLNARPFN